MILHGTSERVSIFSKGDISLVDTCSHPVWADHANEISIAYSGTGALKTDFTRTGKRTKVGALEDGYKSVMRYLKNNFFDGARQDAFDLMTGTWTPARGWSPSSLIVDRRPLITRAVIILLSSMTTLAINLDASFHARCHMCCGSLYL